MSDAMRPGDSQLPPDLPERLDGLFAAAFRSAGTAGTGAHTTVRLRELGDDESLGEALRASKHREGRYAIGDEVGRGGMGVVYLGLDTELGRPVAVKTLQDRHAHDPLVQARFSVEAQIGGQLQHPGLVPVHEFGRWSDGRPFFAMKLVKGESFATLLAQTHGDDDRWRCLQVFAAVCQAVAYAHAHGVVHRDLKPSNVMVGRYGEVQVLDWGLAKVLGDHSIEAAPTSHSPEPSRPDGTATGVVLGTPAYMAPEQAGGRQALVDRRSDVFSLGAMLCELLTGVPAYDGRPADVLAKAQAADLAAAHVALTGCGGAPELVALARHCLAVDPAERPADAQAIATAVTDYLAAAELRRREAELAAAAAAARAAAERRARRLATALAAGVLLSVLLAGVAYSSWATTRDERAAAVETQLVRGIGEIERATTAAQLDGENSAVRWAEACSAAAALVETARRSDAAEARQLQLEDLHRTTQRAAEMASAAREAATAQATLLTELHSLRSRALATMDAGLLPGVAADYRKLFAQHDLDVTTDDAAVAAIGTNTITADLIDGLDLWLLVTSDSAAEPRTTGERLRSALHELDPDEWRGEVRDASGDDPQALLALAEAMPAPTPPTIVHVMLARKLARAGAGNEGMRFLAQVHEYHPATIAVHLGIAGIGAHLGGRHQLVAEPHARAALALRPADATCQQLFADLSSRSEDVGTLLDELERRIAVNPEALAPRISRVSLLVQVDAERAAAEATALVEASKGNVTAHGALLLASLAQQDQATAMRELDWIAAHPVTDQQLHTLLETCCYVARVRPTFDSEHKLLLHEMAWRTSGHRCEPCRLDFARHNALAGRMSEAEQLVRGHLEVDPASPEGVVMLASYLAKAGKVSESTDLLRQQVARRPSDGNARYALGIDLANTGDLDGAEQQLQALQGLDPTRYRTPSEMLENVVLCWCGLRSAAVEVLQRGLARQSPGSSEWLFYSSRLAEALTAVGRTEDAAPLIEYVLATPGRADLQRRLRQFLADNSVPGADDPQAMVAQLPDPPDLRSALVVTARLEVLGMRAAATDVWARALAANPDLSKQRALSAWCLAARNAICCAAGRAGDTADSDVIRRRQWLTEARTWLEQDLTRLRKPDILPRVARRRVLDWWLHDAELALTREPVVTSQLTVEEATDWQALWQRVADALDEVRK